MLHVGSGRKSEFHGTYHNLLLDGDYLNWHQHLKNAFKKFLVATFKKAKEIKLIFEVGII